MVTKIKKLKISWEQLVDLGIYLWLFLLPWQARWIVRPGELYGTYWEYGTYSIYASEVLLVMILLLLAVHWQGRGQARELAVSFWQALLLPKINLTKLVVGLLFWLLLANSWSQDVHLSLYRWGQLLMGVAGVVWLTVRRISWQRIASILVAAGILQGWLALTQFLDQQVVGSAWLGMSAQRPDVYGVSVIQAGLNRWLRAYGSLPHPNILGGFLTFTLLLAWRLLMVVEPASQAAAGWIQKRLKLFSFALAAAIFFLMSGILLSFSRASWIAVAWSAAGLGFYTIFFQKKLVAAYIKILLLLILPTLVWFTLYPLPFLTRLQGQEVLERQSIAERQLSYYDTVDISKNFWLYGSGFGTYTKVLAAANPDRPLSLNQPVHNGWLLVLAEWGIVGLGILILLFWFIWQKSKDKFFTFLILSSLALLLFFDHWWLSLVFGNTFLFLLLIINLTWPKSLSGKP